MATPADHMLAPLSTIQAVADIIHKLHDLYCAIQEANAQLLSIIAQLNTLKAALDQVDRLMQVMPFDEAVYMDLDLALQACDLHMAALDRRILKLDVNHYGTSLKLRSKVVVVLESQGMAQTLARLDHMTNALNLLITVLTSRTITEGRKVLRRGKTRKMFKQIEDDAASVQLLFDEQSFINGRGSAPPAFGKHPWKRFAFDKELLNSKVYSQTRARRSRKKSLETLKSQSETGSSCHEVAGHPVRQCVELHDQNIIELPSHGLTAQPTMRLAELPDQHIVELPGQNEAELADSAVFMLENNQNIAISLGELESNNSDLSKSATAEVRLRPDGSRWASKVLAFGHAECRLPDLMSSAHAQWDVSAVHRLSSISRHTVETLSLTTKAFELSIDCHALCEDMKIDDDFLASSRNASSVVFAVSAANYYAPNCGARRLSADIRLFDRIANNHDLWLAKIILFIDTTGLRDALERTADQADKDEASAVAALTTRFVQTARGDRNGQRMSVMSGEHDAARAAALLCLLRASLSEQRDRWSGRNVYDC